MLESLCLIMNSKPISTQFPDQAWLSPLHFMKLNWFQSDSNNFLFSSSADEFRANMNLIKDQLGEAQQSFTRMLKQMLMGGTKQYFKNHPSGNFFKPGDIVLSLKSNGYHLCSVIKTFPQYCLVLSSERSPPIKKNVHCTLLALIFRPRSNENEYQDTNSQEAAVADSEANYKINYISSYNFQLGQHKAIDGNIHHQDTVDLSYVDCGRYQSKVTSFMSSDEPLVNIQSTLSGEYRPFPVLFPSFFTEINKVTI